MSRVLRLRRGSTAETAAFRGALAEVTVDTSTWALVVHDNVTVGGHRLATEAYVENNKAVTSTGNAAPSQDVTQGSLWFDSVSGRLYVNYNGAWIDASPTVENSIIGNLQIDDTTIRSYSNANINLDPNGTGNVNIVGNLHIESRYIELGNNDEFVIQHLDAGTGGNPYNRIRLTTAPVTNANIAISISATSTSQMFFNPESGNIGINIRNPVSTFQVNGSFRSNSSVVSNGYSGGYQFDTANLGSTGLYHIVPGNGDPSSVKILHDGSDLVSFFDNNFVSYGGNISVYRDFSIGGNATLPSHTTIGSLMNFTPSNAKLRYADDVDSFSQFAMQNKSNANTASTDIAVFSDAGTDDINFVDVGIASSTYSQDGYDLYGPNDSYLIGAGAAGSKLILNTYNDSDVVIATGGTTQANIIARFRNGVGILPGSTNKAYDLGNVNNAWRTLHVGNIMLNGSELSPGTITPPSSTPPVSPTEGQLWFDTLSGKLFVRIGTAWVDTSLGTNVTTVPEHSTGRSGDIAGLVAYDVSYMYYCTSYYDGSSHIWKRVAWSVGTW